MAPSSSSRKMSKPQTLQSNVWKAVRAKRKMSRKKMFSMPYTKQAITITPSRIRPMGSPQVRVNGTV